jgi:hypothetical protein
MKITIQPPFGKGNLPEPGQYKARIVKTEDKIAKSGKDMVVLHLEVSPETSLTQHYLVTVLDDNGEPNKSTMANYSDILRAVGAKIEVGQEVNVSSKTFLGREAVVTLGYDDDDTEKKFFKVIVWHDAASIPAPKPAALVPKAIAPSVLPHDVGGNDIDGDDIPF